jgi:hypothetical protein
MADPYDVPGFAPTYGTQPGQAPDQTAGYGVSGQPYSGQPYSGHTPLPVELDPRRPARWPAWQVVLVTLCAVLIVVGLLVVLRVYVFPPTTVTFGVQ